MFPLGVVPCWISASELSKLTMRLKGLTMPVNAGKNTVKRVGLSKVE
jgi:hypothetical protein